MPGIFHPGRSFTRLSREILTAASIGPLVVAGVLSLAAHMAMGQGFLIGVDANRNLYDIDRATGDAWTFRQLPDVVGTPTGLTYSGIPYQEDVYVSSSSTLFAGYWGYWGAMEFYLVGSFADIDIQMQSVEWNPSVNSLYGMSNGELFVIDTWAGAATSVGNTGIAGESSIVFDSTHGIAYMTSSATDSLYALDLATATATLIGPLNGPTNPRALAYVPDDDAIYLVCSDTCMLYTVDRASGAAHSVGSMGGCALVGLAWQLQAHCPGFLADYDGDGGVNGADIGAFIADYEVGAACADVDRDGGVTPADLAWFFMCYEAC